MKTFPTTPLPHGRDLKTKLEFLRTTHYGPKPGEGLHPWLERLQEDGHAILLTRTQARDAPSLRMAEAKAKEDGILMVAIDPPVEESTGDAVVLTRTQARDVATYRTARAEADRRGVRLLIKSEE